VGQHEGLPPPLFCKHALALCDCIRFLHGHDVAHRDLKPGPRRCIQTISWGADGAGRPIAMISCYALGRSLVAE
jgi:hypothetical protein